MTLFPELPQPRSASDQAREVFDHWKLVTKHPKSNMDNKRMTLIIARLHDGYGVDDLKLAALGIANCPWNQGHNPDHRVYDSVELCYRNADQVDRFMAEGENAQKRAARIASEVALKAVEIERVSATSEVYRENRVTLLRIVGK